MASFVNSDGKTLTLGELDRVQWTAIEDLAEEPEPDRLDELEDQSNELQSDKAAMLERLEALEAAVKSYGKRKAVAMDNDDDDDDAIIETPAAPTTASSSKRRSRK